MDLKPLNKDIVVRNIPERDMVDSPIYFVENTDETKVQYFEVLRTADDVTLVKEGDVVMVNWTKMTPPFPYDIDGKEEQIAITDETQVEAVIEYE